MPSTSITSRTGARSSFAHPFCHRARDLFDVGPIDLAATDLDGDGVHELFGTRYVRTRYVDSIPVPFDEARNGPENCLFRFDGKRWVDVTREAGIAWQVYFHDPEGVRLEVYVDRRDAPGGRALWHGKQETLDPDTVREAAS